MELFGTAGIRGAVSEQITPEFALRVGHAAGLDGAEFVVGRDGRETGPALAAAVAAGLKSAGVRVIRVGQVPTPTLALASRGRRGVMVTASHNPPTDNGLKLFADGMEYDRDAERRIESRFESPSGTSDVPWNEWSAGEDTDPLQAYRETVAEYGRGYGAPLDGLAIAVDCGNGMAALASPQVLRALGARVVALNANVDGHFPGRAPKPTPDSLSDLRSFLQDSEYFLGIGHDGDADRVVFIDGDGDVIHEDTVIAILAEAYVRKSDADDPVVVTTPNASERVDERVEAGGGRVERVRLGALHEGVTTTLEHGDSDTEVVFAAEPWKHIHPGLGPWIDGVASAAVFARLVADAGLSTLRAPIIERPYRKISIQCPDDRKSSVMDSLEAALSEAFPTADISADYGIRLVFPDGSWLLVRPSGTEPYIRLYAEGTDVDQLVEQSRQIVDDVMDEIE